MDQEIRERVMESFFQWGTGLGIVSAVIFGYLVIEQYNVLIGVFAGLGIGSGIVTFVVLIQRKMYSKWFETKSFENRSAV